MTKKIEFQKDWPAELNQIITSMLDLDPSKRPDLSEVLKMNIFSQFRQEKPLSTNELYTLINNYIRNVGDSKERILPDIIANLVSMETPQSRNSLND